MAKDIRAAAKPAPQPREKPKPVHEVRLGRIKAAIWRNDTEAGVRHNVTISRLYKDGDSWKRSDSFGRQDLPLVAKVADLAHTWIFEHGQSDDPPAQPDGEDIPY